MAGGPDCDDGRAAIHPGAPEACEDGIDQDCDGADAPCGSGGTGGGGAVDDDGDGFTEDDGDCDDARSDVHPGAEEIPYDGIDQTARAATRSTWTATGIGPPRSAGPTATTATPPFTPARSTRAATASTRTAEPATRPAPAPRPTTTATATARSRPAATTATTPVPT